MGFIQKPSFPKADALLGRKSVRYCTDSRLINVKVISAVCEIANGAIGPYAMNKLLSGTCMVTSDGLSLVREMRFRADQPIVNLLLKALEFQDREAGDGSTRMLLLIGSLLAEAEKLMEKNIHPSRICQWFDEAASEATGFLARMSKKAEGFEEQLCVATTACAGRWLTGVNKYLIYDIVDCVSTVTQSREGRKIVDREALSIETIDSGNASDSFLLKGCLIWGSRAHPAMPRVVKNPKVAIVDFPLDCFNKPAYVTRMPLCKVESVTRVGELWNVMRERGKLLSERIDAISNSRANVMICKRGIGEAGISMLARRGIFAMERVMKDLDVLRIARATGTRIVTDPIDIESSDLGAASSVEEKEFVGKRAVIFENPDNTKAATFIIFGSNSASTAVSKRVVETATGAVISLAECSRVVPGGGGAEAAASKFLRKRMLEFSSKKQLVYEGFANALTAIPLQIARSTGADAMKLLSELDCYDSEDAFGIDATRKKIANMYESAILDPLKVVSSAIRNASDFVCQLIDIDLVMAEPHDMAGKDQEQNEGQSHIGCGNKDLEGLEKTSRGSQY